MEKDCEVARLYRIQTLNLLYKLKECPAEDLVNMVKAVKAELTPEQYKKFSKLRFDYGHSPEIFSDLRISYAEPGRKGWMLIDAYAILTVSQYDSSLSKKFEDAVKKFGLENILEEEKVQEKSFV